MKILMLVSRVPYPLEKGDKLRAFHQLRILSRSHEMHLFCLNDSDLHPDAIDKLQLYCKSIHIHNLSPGNIVWNVTRSLFNGLPFQAGYFYDKRAAKKINKLVEDIRPDHIYCQLVRMAEYVKHLEIRKTLDYQDVFSKGLERRMLQAPWFSRPVFRSEYKRMLKYEKAVFDRFDNKTIISLPDRDLIPHPGNNNITVIGNGVNHDYFQPQSINPVYDILFTGNMGYPPNIDSALYLIREILPLVHKTRPETTVLIAGANPHPKVKALASDKVQIGGWVRDMRDCYSQAKVFVAPMRIGTGLQNKLLEAMCMELPCITSSLVNNALEARENEEILIGNSTEDYAEKIISVLQFPDRYRSMGKNCSRFVRTRFDWEKCTKKLEELIVNTA
ncbi:MAG: glycosyltransferase [Bacteroidetes bacterium]|nr:glycosyltransferase [Bacteroidota bacterium]